eukprot:jgi/Bigna1/83973/fgenesh1_pg.119_\
MVILLSVLSCYLLTSAVSLNEDDTHAATLEQINLLQNESASSMMNSTFSEVAPSVRFRETTNRARAPTANEQENNPTNGRGIPEDGINIRAPYDELGLPPPGRKRVDQYLRVVGGDNYYNEDEGEEEEDRWNDGSHWHRSRRPSTARQPPPHHHSRVVSALERLRQQLHKSLHREEEDMTEGGEEEEERMGRGGGSPTKEQADVENEDIKMEAIKLVEEMLRSKQISGKNLIEKDDENGRRYQKALAHSSLTPVMKKAAKLPDEGRSGKGTDHNSNDAQEGKLKDESKPKRHHRHTQEEEEEPSGRGQGRAGREKKEEAKEKLNSVQQLLALSSSSIAARESDPHHTAVESSSGSKANSEARQTQMLLAKIHELAANSGFPALAAAAAKLIDRALSGSASNGGGGGKGGGGGSSSSPSSPSSSASVPKSATARAGGLEKEISRGAGGGKGASSSSSSSSSKSSTSKKIAAKTKSSASNKTASAWSTASPPSKASLDGTGNRLRNDTTGSPPGKIYYFGRKGVPGKPRPKKRRSIDYYDQFIEGGDNLATDVHLTSYNCVLKEATLTNAEYADHTAGASETQSKLAIARGCTDPDCPEEVENMDYNP